MPRSTPPHTTVLRRALVLMATASLLSGCAVSESDAVHTAGLVGRSEGRAGADGSLEQPADVQGAVPPSPDAVSDPAALPVDQGTPVVAVPAASETQASLPGSGPASDTVPAPGAASSLDGASSPDEAPQWDAPSLPAAPSPPATVPVADVLLHESIAAPAGEPAGALVPAPDEPSAGSSQSSSASWCAVLRRTQAATGDGALGGTPGFAIAGMLPGIAHGSVSWRLTDSRAGVLRSGQLVTDATGAFTVTIAIGPGEYRVTASATGAGACSASIDVTVVPPARWASGASCNGVADGQFAAWRQSSVPVAGTWVDDNTSMLGLWPLRPGAEYAGWTGDLDIAVGAIGPGETWAAAARGDYDSRWRQSLESMAALWAPHSGTLNIRFAHEFNGDWYSWEVHGSEVADFRAAWKRYRALQQAVFPTSRLVFAPNSETAYANDLDWRAAFPGAQYVDVMAVDYYNMWPWVDTEADFQRVSLSYDRTGAPRGLQRHLEFARSVGLPFAVSEWGNNATFGDSAVFMEQMHAFFAANAGTGAGQLEYEILFNCGTDREPWRLFPAGTAPRAAAAYRDLF